MTLKERQDLDGERDETARAAHGAVITRRKHTKKRDERVTPGPSRRGYLGRDSRPIAHNLKYGATGASPGRAISTGLSTGQMQHPPRAKTWRSPANKDGCGASWAEHPWGGVASARAQGGVAQATRTTCERARGHHAAASGGRADMPPCGHRRGRR